MFRELLHYSTQSISQSGYCSLQLHSAHSSAQLVLVFWSGNIYNCLHLAEFSSSLLEAKKALEVISCFLVIPSKPPIIHSLIGFDGRTVKSLVRSRPLVSFPLSLMRTFIKFLPTVRILDRYDLHSVLQFLLMKLRIALDLAWVNNLPELRKVRI